MQYVPSLLSPGTAPETGLEVKALAGIRRAKPVQARILPPPRTSAYAGRVAL